MHLLFKVSCVVITFTTAIVLAIHSNLFSSDRNRWDPVKLDDNWKEKYESNKNLIGNKYAYYLVGLNKLTNIYWWEDTHQLYLDRKNKEKLSNDFKSIEGTIDQACEKVYLKTESEVNMNEVWEFCSPLRSTPKTIKDNKDTYKEDSIGFLYRDSLLSVNTNESIWFWKTLDILNQDQSTLSEYFKTKTTALKLGTLNMKRLCEELYNQSTSNKETKDQPKDTSVIKYCSLKNN